MGLWLQEVSLVFMGLVYLSEAQWQGRATHNENSVMFSPRALGQVSQQGESRTPPLLAPLRYPSPMTVQDSLGAQSKQLLQGQVAKLTWSFPRLPEESEQPEIPFELRHPTPVNSVAVQCRENSVYVEVMEDLFGTGQPLQASGFSLGGCAPVGEDGAAQVLVFEAELHDCGSMPTLTDNELVYAFTILYTPQDALSGTQIIRSSSALVGIECHYPRIHDVSSNALMPTWVPYAATMVADELLIFSLQLMTDDWRFKRPSNQYYLGEFMNIEASVMSYNHVPFRLFVDNCVATAVPDINAVPRYSFIENNGCMVDAKITGSSSHFLPRTQGDKLQFQLETFRFQQENSGLVYITCAMKVAAASIPTDAEQKACSFSANEWMSADESDQVCACCDSKCGMRIGSDQALHGLCIKLTNFGPMLCPIVKSISSTDLRWESAVVGPIGIKKYGFGQM